MLVKCCGMDVFLRRLRAGDIKQVVEIEKEAFSPLWMSTPFKRELNNRYARYLVACPSPGSKGFAPPPEQEEDGAGIPLLKQVSKKVQGLMGLSQEEESPEESIAGYVSVWFQGDEAHITEIAVRERLRGRGIGELLLIGSIKAAQEYGSKVMTLEARVSNFVAIRLYEKYDFKQVGIRKGYYSDNREDAAIMTTSPIGTEDYLRMFQELQDAFRSRWGEIYIKA